jgi:hypothetical protein
MKTKLILAGTALFVAAAFTAQAQYQDTTTTTRTTTTSDTFGAVAGNWEFTVGGSGGSNNDIDNSAGGINVALGYYLADTLSLSVRQGASYSNGSGGGAEFDGSTFIALDQHFGTGRLRPFVGVNFGGFYGDNTNDTFAAGLETGLKLYVKPQTFVFALVNYAWTFDDSDTATDNFDDGAFLWTVGVGFNF